MPRYRVQAGEQIVHRGGDHHAARKAYSAAVAEAESTREEVTLFCDGIVSERFRPQRPKVGFWRRIWEALVGSQRPSEEETNGRA